MKTLLNNHGSDHLFVEDFEVINHESYQLLYILSSDQGIMVVRVEVD